RCDVALVNVSPKPMVDAETESMNEPLVVPERTFHETDAVALPTAYGASVVRPWSAVEPPVNENPEGRVSDSVGEGAFRSPSFRTTAVTLKSVEPATSEADAEVDVMTRSGGFAA